jgi:1,4-dihydroxy-2-naphthoate octaprenyltransferase
MMRRPTPVSAGMRDASLVLQLVAVVLLFAVDWRAGAVGTALFAMGVAYSHPLWRWKSATCKGLICVAGGQGALAVLLGSFATGVPAVTARQLAVAAAASLLVLGMYPLTQIYQIDEDRARGDLTLPVRYGWRRAMLFAWPVASCGLALGLFLVRAALPLSWGWPAAGGAAALASYLGLWAARFARQGPERNHDWAMAASLAVAAPTGLALMVELTRRWQ